MKTYQMIMTIPVILRNMNCGSNVSSIGLNVIGKRRLNGKVWKLSLFDVVILLMLNVMKKIKGLGLMNRSNLRSSSSTICRSFIMVGLITKVKCSTIPIPESVNYFEETTTSLWGAIRWIRVRYLHRCRREEDNRGRKEILNGLI